MTKLKEFFSKPKGVFVGITTLLWLAGIGLVAAGTIDFGTYLSSLSTISVAVIGLYQWYVKKEVQKDNEKLFVDNQLKSHTIDRLQNTNRTLRKQVKS